MKKKIGNVSEKKVIEVCKNDTEDFTSLSNNIDKVVVSEDVVV